MEPKLRMGMIGGGRDAFMGHVHRMAARLDGKCELVCGAFSSTRQQSLKSGEDILGSAGRVYGSYRDMLRKEARLPEEDRMQFVSIVTPNNMHYPVAMAALDAGFHVVCETPMTVSLEEALNLRRKVEQTGLVFCLLQCYTAYPMVQEARSLAAGGKLGTLRRVVAEFPSGWLASRLETSGQKQAAWRTDPRRIGKAGCMADLGSHAHYLARFVTGERVAEVCADLATFVNGRPLEDDGSVLLRFDSGARGVLWASQVAIGEENTLSLRVYGTEGSVVWTHRDPNTLIVHWGDRATEMRRTGTPHVGAYAADATRLADGRPEGYIEAFANIYRNFCMALRRVLDGDPVPDAQCGFPTVSAGVADIAFVEAVVRSAGAGEKWIPVEPAAEG